MGKCHPVRPLKGDAIAAVDRLDAQTPQLEALQAQCDGLASEKSELQELCDTLKAAQESQGSSLQVLQEKFDGLQTKHDDLEAQLATVAQVAVGETSFC